ncbi:hypothetical protein [Botryobacter ruber]|uniref:hypothetical protein n=1 Tax=Botryobacter ruber TaxID=2171629 RepID=UPI000FEC3494|nr:hypothetical protein [Botryobacter ruber]
MKRLSELPKHFGTSRERPTALPGHPVFMLHLPPFLLLCYITLQTNTKNLLPLPPNPLLLLA